MHEKAAQTARKERALNLFRNLGVLSSRYKYFYVFCVNVTCISLSFFILIVMFLCARKIYSITNVVMYQPEVYIDCRSTKSMASLRGINFYENNFRVLCKAESP